MIFSKKYPPRIRDKKRQSGFTLIEVLIVVVMIGILGSIAAPGWLGFVSQQRVSRANDVVLRALQSTQSQARKTKLSYSFVLRLGSNGVPEVASFPDAGGTTSFSSIPSSAWKSVGADIGLAPGQVWIGTNLSGTNTGSGQPSIITNTPTGRITFDNTGVLLTSSRSPAVGLTVAVAQPSGSNDANPSTMRCVQITTVLGSMETRQGDTLCNK